MRKINILVIGGTGFVGRVIASTLNAGDYRVTVLSRGGKEGTSLSADIPVIRADVLKPGLWQELISEYDVVINLAGVSIFRRWTEKAQQEIAYSRIIATRNIVDALQIRSSKVKQFFSISGVGYYGFHKDEVLDENAAQGHDFLASVAAQWEQEAVKAAENGIRAVICRLGHVLGPDGGVLSKLLSLAKLHLASRWGNGKQWISWVHQADVAGAFLFLLDNDTISGTINITAPEPVQNHELMATLSRLIGKRVFIPPVPEFLLRLITGEFSTVFVNGQRVIPRKLLASGHTFKYSTLETAMQNLLLPY